MIEINRKIYPVLKTELNYDEITILIGARQVGKTHLMKKLFKLYQKQGKKAKFYDLEQPETLLLFNKSEQDIIKELVRDNNVIFLDEFYYIKNASHIFKAIYDSGYKTKIFASGSSSLQIHKHLKESLAGRKRIYTIFPCSYQEMIDLWGNNCLENYLKYGGLPGISKYKNTKDIILLLSDIHQSYILKDVKSLLKEENIRIFNNLIYLLAERQGSIISINNLARELTLTSKSIDNYLNILSHTGVAFLVMSFSRNMGNELKKSKKTYLYDIGIRNMILKDFRNLAEREDRGYIYESFVFLELQKMVDPLSEIRFWRTKDGKEVDFIFIRNRIPFPIEVKSRIKPGEVTSGLSAFLHRYPQVPKAFVFNLEYEGQVDFNNTKIYYKKLTAISKFIRWIN
ncbi:MAG: ATP-binding protein [Candidatus Aminicenantes bacterium]|nr:ATP-binding protein [Candidatus Aminicenantes bacterium]